MASCPVNALPIELLTNVFLHIISSSTFNRIHGKGRRSPLLDVLPVCKCWHNAAKSDPRLWTFVYIHPRNSASEKAREGQALVTRTYLSRSKRLPLYIHIRADHDDPLALEAAFAWLQNDDLERVDHFIVSAGHMLGGTTIRQALIGMPSLRTLRISDLWALPWAHCRWPKLEELEIKQDVMWTQAEFTAFMTGIGECTGLRFLRLFFNPDKNSLGYFRGTPAQLADWAKVKGPTMDLPQLVHLALFYLPVPALVKLFAAIKAPELRDLVVLGRLDEARFDFQANKVELGFPKLKRLNLMSFKLLPIVDAAFRAAPGIQCVELLNPDANDRVIANLRCSGRRDRAYPFAWVDRW